MKLRRPRTPDHLDAQADDASGFRQDAVHLYADGIGSIEHTMAS